jgi:hypothetical protein
MARLREQRLAKERAEAQAPKSQQSATKKK